ncbi:MAG: ABC transporter permease [Gemmataceae bacterium]
MDTTQSFWQSLPVSPVVLASVLVVGIVLGSMIVASKVPLVYNLRNLIVRWRTTLLTAAAFTLVIGLLVVMLAFVNGMYRLTEGSGNPANVMILSDGATDEMFSNLGYGDSDNIEREVVTVDEQGLPLAQPIAVERIQRGDKEVYLCSREVYLVVNQPIPHSEGEKRRRRFVQVRGLVDDQIAARVHDLKLRPGGAWLSSGGVRQLPSDDSSTPPLVVNEALLGRGVAGVLGQDQGKDHLDVGDRFELGDRTWIVTGILDSAGSTFDSEIWIPQAKVKDFFVKDNYTTITVRLADARAARLFAHHVSLKYKNAAVQAQVETAYYSKLGETNKQFLVAIIFVTVIMAIGGVFGVMNTMFAAISQRIRDIGVLRILGFAKWQILVSFLLEALLIALVGGALGCTLGFLANGHSATSMVSSGQGGKSVVLELVVDANILAAGMLLTFVMGLLGGLLPALSAMRLKPLESVR